MPENAKKSFLAKRRNVKANLYYCKCCQIFAEGENNLKNLRRIAVLIFIKTEMSNFLEIDSKLTVKVINFV